MKKSLILRGIALALFLFGLLPERAANALPAFARRYNTDCSMCHTMVPQLNHSGHRFKRLGYRMPDEFDKAGAELAMDELAKLTNYVAARARVHVTDKLKSGTKANFDFEMHDITLFYAGPATRNLAFFFELPFEPEEGHGFLEVGQVNLTFGNDSEHAFVGRVGQIHQFSRVGFGGLDRPIGLANPRVFEVRVNGFRPRHDGVGLEAGYTTGAFTGLLQATNGIKSMGGSVLDNADENNDKDIAALLEYVSPESDASISALYVYGKAPKPQSAAGVTLAGSKETRYHRVYLFADYTFDGLGLRPIAGGGVGLDNQFVSGIGTSTIALVSASSSRSWFGFLELDQKLGDNTYALARFDYDDVTNKAEASANSTQKTWMGTLGLAHSYQNHLKLSAEYNLTHTKNVANSHVAKAELQFNF